MRRLSLAGDDRHLLIPLDHSVSDGPIVPAAKWDDLLRALVAGGADGIITTDSVRELLSDRADGDDVLTLRVNTALRTVGFPPVTRALRMKTDDVAKGATGKVLKRVMRDRFAAREQR
ncbi:hypothetical protein [Streptomyces sp. NPDC050121]|uniref:hypothetical protein n=1 Tax=Streptomyces sp. NPDC050121 TaxID=3365601 RepID=UPI00379D200E